MQFANSLQKCGEISNRTSKVFFLSVNFQATVTTTSLFAGSQLTRPGLAAEVRLQMTLAELRLTRHCHPVPAVSTIEDG